MIRNFKTLGLALVAIFAMSAMAASAASADVLTSDGPVTLDGEEVGAANENALTSFGAETRCPESTYTGHKFDTTPHELIESGASTVTLTPHYNQADCVSVSGGSSFSSTVEMTSCDYVLHLGDNGEVTADVECDNPGDAIHVTQFSGQSHGFRVCSVTVPQQTGLTGGTVTNTTGGHLLLSGTFTGIEATRSGLCGSTSTEEGEFHVNATVSGTNAEGGSTSVSVSS